MNRHVIGQFEDEDRTPDSLQNFRPPGGGCTVHETHSDLEGRQVETGVYATSVERDGERPAINGDRATYEEDVWYETVGCRFLFDPETGLLSGDSSTVEKLFDDLTAAGTPITRVELDLDAWADALERQDDAGIWMRGWREGDDDDPADVGVEFHNVEQAGRGDETNQLGWYYPRGTYNWNGTAAASGYVGVYSPRDRPAEDVAAWLRDDIRPYVRMPAPDEQQHIGSDEFRDKVASHLEDEGVEVSR